MPLPQFSTEYNSGEQPMPLEGMGQSPSGTFAAIKEGAAGSLMASGITRVKGFLGDQTPVPRADAEKEMRDGGYDPSVLPSSDTVSRGYLDALQDQQSALKRNGVEAEQAGLHHGTGIMPTWRGMSEFVGGSVADSPFFLLGGGAAGLGLRALGIEAAGGLTGFGVRALEGETIAGGYDAARKEIGTAPGDKDLGMYDVARDMMLGGVVGGAFGPRGKIPSEAEAQGFIHRTIPDATITSGFRTVEHNAEIGGVKGSLHTKGQAVDVVLPKGVTAEQFRAAIEKAGLPVTEFLVEKRGDPHSTGDHIHWGWGPKKGHPVPDDPVRVAQGTADAMRDHVPVSDDPQAPTRPVWDTPEAQAQTARVDAMPKTQTPELEQLSKSAQDAVKDAENAARLVDPQTDLAGLKTHLQEAEESVQGEADLHKGVEAAVRCAMVKGWS